MVPVVNFQTISVKIRPYKNGRLPLALFEMLQLLIKNIEIDFLKLDSGK